MFFFDSCLYHASTHQTLQGCAWLPDSICVRVYVCACVCQNMPQMVVYDLSPPPVIYSLVSSQGCGAAHSAMVGAHTYTHTYTLSRWVPYAPHALSLVCTQLVCMCVDMVYCVCPCLY